MYKQANASLPSMMLRVQIGAIFHLDILVCVLDQSPELTLNHIFWDLAIRVSKLCEPVLFEIIALFLKGAQVVLATIFESKFASTNKALRTVPIILGSGSRGGIKAGGMVTKITAITN